LLRRRRLLARGRGRVRARGPHRRPGRARAVPSRAPRRAAGAAPPGAALHARHHRSAGPGLAQGRTTPHEAAPAPRRARPSHGFAAASLSRILEAHRLFRTNYRRWDGTRVLQGSPALPPYVIGARENKLRATFAADRPITQGWLGGGRPPPLR